jgi:hypothetical protein
MVTVCDTLITERLTAQTQLFKPSSRNLYSRIGVLLSGQVCTEVGTPITIIEPASAVTSGGLKISRMYLSNQGGTIRFSNVSGGTQDTPIVLMEVQLLVATEKMYCRVLTLVVRDSRDVRSLFRIQLF